jgi:hypothetical protein
VNEIVAAVANPLVDTGDNFFGLAPFSGAANLLCQLSLCFCQCLFVTAEEARIVYILAIGQRTEGFKANVNADFFRGRRQELCLGFSRKANEPLRVDAANCASFDCAVNRAMQTNGNVANLRQA